MSLPEPSFITRDANAITAEIVTAYETATGKTLQPAQPEMLLINLIAYREMLVRTAIQEAAKQNLVNYATFPMLDYLGELVGCSRLPEQPARCTIRFTLTAVQAAPVIVPLGTRVTTKDNLYVFATDKTLTIAAGQTFGEVTSVAETLGTAPNGYLAGEVNTLVAPVAWVSSAASITVTSGGDGIESDDRYRTRVKEAPEALSTAGAKGAYLYWAKSAHAQICDVAVTSPSAGVVNIYPLMTTGTPAAEILTLVASVVSADTVRPLTDNVSVLAPTKVDFAITAAVTLYAWVETVTATEQINDALTVYAAGLRARLGVDIVRAQIIAIIANVYGVYSADLTAPAADTVIAVNEWANCTAITVTVAGYVNG